MRVHPGITVISTSTAATAVPAAAVEAAVPASAAAAPVSTTADDSAHGGRKGNRNQEIIGRSEEAAGFGTPVTAATASTTTATSDAVNNATATAGDSAAGTAARGRYWCGTRRERT